MDPHAALALFDRSMREGAPPDGPGARIERVGRVVRQTGAEDGWNGVVWSGLDETDADAAIARQVRHFAALGLDFEWKLYGHDRPSDLGRRLRAAGFTARTEEALMVAESADAARGAGPPRGVRLVTVTDRAGVDLVAEVHARAFGSDGARVGRQLLARLTAAPRTVVAVVALAADVPVSAARMELPPGAPFAGLWGGGTVPAWRGRGLYRALVAHRARVAVDRGYRYLQVDASDQSRPILGRLGFRQLTTTTPYVHEA